MADGKISPSNFNFDPQDINNINEEEEIVNFTSFLDETEQNEAKQRAIAEEEIRQREAVLNEVIEEENQAQTTKARADEEESIENQKAQNLLRDRQIASKTGKQNTLNNRKLNQGKQESRKNISKEELKSKENEIEEHETSIEEKTLEDTQRQMTARKGVSESVDQEKENFKAHDKAKNKDKLKQQEHNQSLREVKHSHSQSKHIKHLNQNADAAMPAFDVSQKATTLGTHKTEQTHSLKSELQKEFEKLASKLIAQAQVLEDGDVIETTVLLNLEGSIFDQGEVVVTAYKYRPLEVNLKFKKFNKEAQKVLKENKGSLKNVLKRKSLTVHQLELIED